MSRYATLAEALDHESPAETLRALVQRFVDAGVPVDELQSDLTSLRLDRRTQGSDADEDIILDTQDLLAGWCAPGSKLTSSATRPAEFVARRHSARAAPTERTGTLGTTEAVAAFERIGWGPLRNDWHDLGIDLFVQVRDRRRFDAALVITVQVKSGPSAFSEPVVEDGRTSGWIYRDTVDRFDDWLSQGLPHLLVLSDIDSRICYWVHVHPGAVEVTGSGSKILVPSDQQIDEASLDHLESVAASQKARIDFEGTAWGAGPSQVPSAQLWRYALTVPRLVAPHPNRVTEHAIGAPEALALLARARHFDWDRIAEGVEGVPSRLEAIISPDWGWQFAGSLASALVDGDPDLLYACAKSAPDNRSAAAASVASAVWAMSHDEPQQALQILEDATEGDFLEPEDLAWINLQTARILVELGAVADGRSLAMDALQTFAKSSDDVTASAMSAGAAWLLFSTAEFLGGDLSSTLTAADNASSWWRSQETSWGLTRFLKHSFRSWGHDSSLRFESVDETARGLLAATIQADFAGDGGAERASGSLLGRYALMNAVSAHDEAGATEALQDLRRSGDHEAVGLASKRLRHIGPLQPLQRVAESIGENSWTRSSVRTNFLVWSQAAEVMSEESAESAASFCVEVTMMPEDFLPAQHPLPFYLFNDAIPALSALLVHPAKRIHELAATLLMGLTEASPMNELLSQDLARLARRIDWQLVSTPVRESGEKFATNGASSLSDAVALSLGMEDLEGRKRRAGDGDLMAAATLADAGQLPQDIAAQVIEQTAAVVDSIVKSADVGNYSIGSSTNYAGLLTLLSLDFSALARWDSVLQLLASPNVQGEEKALALRLLAWRFSEVPDEMRGDLTKLYQAIGSSAGQITPREETHALDHIRLGQKLDLVGPDELRHQLVRLVSSPDQRMRTAAATLLAEQSDMDAAVPLAGLCADDDLTVATAGAWGAARAYRKESSNGGLATLVLQALESPGVARCLACLDGLHREGTLPMTDRLAPTIAELAAEHPSVRVRIRCDEVLDRSQSSTS